MAVGPAWTPVWLSAAKENPERQLHFRIECFFPRYYTGITFHPCKVPSCETDEQERLFGSREADLGRVSMKLR